MELTQARWSRRTPDGVDPVPTEFIQFRWSRLSPDRGLLRPGGLDAAIPMESTQSRWGRLNPRVVDPIGVESTPSGLGRLHRD